MALGAQPTAQAAQAAQAGGLQNAAAVQNATEVAVLAWWAKRALRRPEINISGVTFYALKTLAPVFKHTTYPVLRAFFRERPHLFLVRGQLVLNLQAAAAAAAAAPSAPHAAGPPPPGPPAGASHTPPTFQDGPHGPSTSGGHAPGGAHHVARPLRCHLCGFTTASEYALMQHNGSALHLVRLYVSALRDGRAAQANVPGVTVSIIPEATVAPGSTTHYTFSVTSGAVMPPGGVVLKSIRPLQPIPGVTLSDELGLTLPQPKAGLWLVPNASLDVGVRFVAPDSLGRITGMVVFDFGTVGTIPRMLCFTCDDVSLGPSIAPVAPFVKPPRKHNRANNTDIVPGEMPPGAIYIQARPLGKHLVPADIAAEWDNKQWGKLEKRLKRRLVDVKSYALKLQTLEWVEELQQQVDIRAYDMESRELELSGKYLGLQVPGLAENRPSVMKGDALYVKPSDGSSFGLEYEGFVHVVRKEEVLLRFHPSFHSKIWMSGRKFDVRFTINRGVFRLKQEALHLLRSGASRLDPDAMLPANAMPPTLIPALGLNAGPGLLQGCLQGNALMRNTYDRYALDWADDSGRRWALKNPHLQQNTEQLLAVREVVRGGHHPLPYLIFGPPGTGKTSTLVEAAVQVMKHHPNSRLLLAAPSNSAADQLAQRMLKAGTPPSSLLRIIAYCRPQEDVPSDLFNASGVCNWDDGDGAFTMPGAQRVMSKRVVVVTCSMAGKLYNAGVQPGYFTHIMLDEAGHAEEPLALCCLAGLAGADTRITFAGDPRQLGPILLSPLAGKHGLATSAMERLLKLHPYARDSLATMLRVHGVALPGVPNGEAHTSGVDSAGVPHYNSAYITKLLRNYRSHPGILEVPNRMFYEDELLACGDCNITHALLRWEGLPNPEHPVIFHHLVGKDDREGNSPSWFNELEARQVVKYIGDLMASRRGGRINAGDIGVITPYRKQVQKLQSLLRAKWPAVKVGSVEEFQGQERQIIIISTVRSSHEHMGFDAQFRLGFLSNPKRFNVAITRAKALVIVIGNAQVLVHDESWRTLLTGLRRRRCCVGQELPADVMSALDGQDAEGEVDELASALAGLVLTAAGSAAGPTADEVDEAEHYAGVAHAEGGEMPRWE